MFNLATKLYCLKYWSNKSNDLFSVFCIDVRKSASKIPKNAVVDCLRENGDISIWWRLKGRSFFEVKGDTLAHRLSDVFDTHMHCDRLLNINGKISAETDIAEGLHQQSILNLAMKIIIHVFFISIVFFNLRLEYA